MDDTHSRLARHMKLTQLRAVDAIDRAGSLLAAARVLGVTQPALTRTLREAETMLGQSLFVRQPRGVTPTHAGRAVADAARRILRELGTLETTLAAPAHPALTIGAIPSAAVGVLPGLLLALREGMPDLDLTVVEGNTATLLAALRHEEIDLMLGQIDLHLSPDLYEQTALYRDALIFAARAGHRLGGRATPGDLAAFPLAVPVYIPGPEQELANMLEQSGVTPRPRMLRAATLGLIRELMLTSDTIAFLPRQMVAGDLARGTLMRIDVGLHRQRGPGGVITLRHRRHAPVVAIIMGLLQQG